MNRSNKINLRIMVFIAIAAIINMIGSEIALIFKLPILYLDTLGTWTVAIILGPLYGMIPGFISGCIAGITTDVYSFFYIPVQLITGFMAGILINRYNMNNKFNIPLCALLVTIPGTLVSALITDILFGGITSSGSGILVQFFHHYFGLGLTLSVFITQFISDFIDRVVMLTVALLVVYKIPNSFINSIKCKRELRRIK